MTSVGSGSFWQQDQNFWARSQQVTQAQTLSSTVIDQMFGATKHAVHRPGQYRQPDRFGPRQHRAFGCSTGRAEPGVREFDCVIVDKLDRFVRPRPRPVPLRPRLSARRRPAPARCRSRAARRCLGLGFLTRGNFTVSDGTFTTTYQSTGTDTVGDLISAINSGAPGNALVRAWLNGSGNLVITSQNKNDTVTVSGDYAAALGFGSTNATFAPTKPPPISHPVVSSSTSATSGSASKSTATPASGISANSALALQTGGTAELLLASSGSPAALSIYWLESRP